jgi:hypothetical protein
MWQSINSYLWMLPPAGCCSPRPCAAPAAAPNAAPVGARSPRPCATPTRRGRGCALLLFARAATWLGRALLPCATRPSRASLLPGRTRRYSAQPRAAAPWPHVHAPPLDPATAPQPQLRGHVRRASWPAVCVTPFAAPWLRAPPLLLLPTRAALPRLPNLETRELGRSGFFILLEWDEPASTGNIPLLG